MILDELVVFEGKDGFKHVFTEGYSSYEEALERRNELYFMSYENSKVVAIKEGQIVEAKDYMDLAYTEDEKLLFMEMLSSKYNWEYTARMMLLNLSKLNDLEGVDEKRNFRRYSPIHYRNLY